MPINIVPTTPEEEVLLLIGDSEEELITSAVITYILTQNDGDVNRAAVAAIQYIVNSLAKRIDEEVGDLKVKFSQLYENYKKLLDQFLKDPALSPLAIGIHKFGGVKKSQADAVRDDPDSRGTALREGFFTQDCNDCFPNRNNFNEMDCQ